MLSEHARCRPQHLQPPTPSRFAIDVNGIVATAFDAVRARAQIPGQGAKAMPSQSEVIETTVSAVAAELERRGLDPGLAPLIPPRF
jgi:hypothetical protein